MFECIPQSLRLPQGLPLFHLRSTNWAARSKFPSWLFLPRFPKSRPGPIPARRLKSSYLDTYFKLSNPMYSVYGQRTWMYVGCIMNKLIQKCVNVAAVFIILLVPAIAWSQTPASDDSVSSESLTPSPTPQNQPSANPLPAKPTPVTPEQTPDEQKKNEKDSEGEQTKRMLWVVPNFGAVNAHTQLPRMSTREKFSLAAKDSVTDYSSYTWAGISAGQAYLLNADPELGRGAAGYGRYYWRTFVDGISGTFFTEAIVPTIRHEDPRYYTMGEGGFFRRMGYAISRAFVTKTDSGGNSFNWSEVAGNGLEAGLSNAYYPPQERGLNQTPLNWGTQMESGVLNHIFQEFWPDIRKDLFRQK